MKRKSTVVQKKTTPVRSKKSRLAKSTKKVEAAVQVVANAPFDARGLSKKEALFVMNVLKGMPRREAMKLATEAIGVEIEDSTARVNADRAMAKPSVNAAIVGALESVGISDELVAQKLRDGLDATAYTQTGLEHVDYKTIHAYIRTVLQVKGQIGADVQNQNNVINYTSFKEDE